MNNSTHISIDDQASCRLGASIFFTTAMAVISSAAFIGNILVIVTVYKTPSLRTSTNYYYVNMAVSDLLCCVTTWPMYLADESSGILFQGSSTECKMTVFFRTASTVVSILSLFLIAVDRFVATVFPLKAKLITRTLRVALLFATWLISTAYCIPFLYYFRTVEVGEKQLCKSAWTDLAVMIYHFTGIVLLEVIPLTAIIILYSRIMRVLNQRLNSEFNASSTQRNRNKQNRNIMNIFKSIVVVFFTWFFLFNFYLVLNMFFPELLIKDRCKLIEGFASYLFPLISTATNPVILFAFSTNFRRALPCRRPFTYSIFRSFCKDETMTPQKDVEFLPELVAYKKTKC
ncbi:QRFP-like peptide receptor [Oculina patagonica]